MLRSLTHYRRIHAALVLAAAAATAVLTGALVVGDSVRGSLRALALDRLGTIDAALVRDDFFDERLAARLAAGAGERVQRVAPLIVLSGSVTHADSGALAAGVAILGVDERFTPFFGSTGEAVAAALPRAEEQIFPSVVINASLARELAAVPGDSVLLGTARPSDVPRETLMGDTDPEDVLATLRATVSAVIPDRGIGRFGLTPHQQAPLDAFVELRTLQRLVDRHGEANALVVASTESRSAGDAELLDRSLRAALRLEDLGLALDIGEDHVSLRSERFVFAPALEPLLPGEASRGTTPGEGPGLRRQEVRVYLANSVRARGRQIPYSTVAAVEPWPGPPSFALTLADGTVAPPLAEDGIYLNTWAAGDLGVEAGDAVELDYYVVGAGEELREGSARFRLAGIVRMSGLAADRGLTPDYPGIRDADDISDWDPPFPVDLDRIRPRDEEYWDRFRGTPKAFVAPATGRGLWSSPFGSITSARYAAGVGLEPPGPASSAQTAEHLRELLLRPEVARALGFEFRDVRREGLQAASGATDFAGLFAAFSFFLILSAALIVGLLFRLGVEQRAREVGLMLGVGYRQRTVRLRWLGEGGLLAAVGAMIGVAGGVGYAALMLWGLRTLWIGAVGSTELRLHVGAVTLAVGWAISVSVVVLSVAGTVWRLGKVPVPALLAGSLGGGVARPRRRIAPWLAWGGLAAGAVLLAGAFFTGAAESPGLAFGTGLALLVSGLAFFSAWCRGAGARSFGRRSALYDMAARNSAWNPGRSMLSVALVASACFVIVTVAANRRQLGSELQERTSGTGGFSLVARADVPLYRDLEQRSARFDLGFPDEDADALDGIAVYPFRVLPGQDASCLNLYRPDRPTILGAPRDFLERGGFGFAATVDMPAAGDEAPGNAERANPWTLLHNPLPPRGDVPVVPAVADANSARWILHLGLGDELEWTDEFGRPLRLRLVALLQRSILQSVVVISEESFLAHFPSRSGHAFFLIDAPWERADEVALALERNLGRFGFDATATPDELASFLSVEHTYLSTFQALGGLGLLLGTLGLAIVMVRNVIERRGELATLRAVGYRRGTLARLVLAENAFLLACGVGIGSLSALIAAAPRLASIHVGWGSLAATLLAVLVIGMFAGAVAVRAALSAPLLPALKEER